MLSAATSFSDDSGGATRPAGVQFGIPEERRYMRGFGPNPGAWAFGGTSEYGMSGLRISFFLTASIPPLLNPRIPRPPLSIENGFEFMMCPAASTGAPSRPAYWHRGIGYDYAFADVVGENVVRLKHGAVRARQVPCSSLEYSKGRENKKPSWTTQGITVGVAFETQLLHVNERTNTPFLKIS